MIVLMSKAQIGIKFEEFKKILAETDIEIDFVRKAIRSSARDLFELKADLQHLLFSRRYSHNVGLIATAVIQGVVDTKVLAGDVRNAQVTSLNVCAESSDIDRRRGAC
jgi:hypothetical protein